MWVKNSSSTGKGMSLSAESKQKEGVEERLGARIWVKVQIKCKQDKKARNLKREIKDFDCKMWCFKHTFFSILSHTVGT